MFYPSDTNILVAMKEVKQNDRYAAYLINDLLLDRDFQEWFIHRNLKDELFWQNWVRQYPMKKDMFEEAKRLLEGIDFVEHFPSDVTVNRSLNSTMALIDQQGSEKYIHTGKKVKMYGALKIAAIIAGLICTISILFYYNRNLTTTETQVIASGFGKLKTVLLPDSTIVTLNANSELSMPDEWREGSPREVWLKGEAYFQVKHLNKNGIAVVPSDRFIVQTKYLTIEVLGTSFDVRDRNDITEVMLKEGSVRVHFKDSAGRSDIVLKPGELIRFDGVNKVLKQRTVVAENYNAWMQKKLILEDPSLREIANYLEDVFGKKIVIESKELANKRIEGPVMLDNLEDALFIISLAMDIQIIHTKDGLIFKSK